MNEDNPEKLAYWLPVLLVGVLGILTVCGPSIKLAWVQHEQRVALEKFREEKAAHRMDTQR